ncbi:hypothetical protein OAP63_10470 [Vibrio sp.]|nr:hypothetical protein [Vibrio sp.]
MLYPERVKELGLPKYRGEKHIHYLMKILLKGYTIDTRQCRYIGIGNLHSEVPKFIKKDFPISERKGRVVDPVTNLIPTQEVIIIWMTKTQRNEYFSRKKTCRRIDKSKQTNVLSSTQCCPVCGANPPIDPTDYGVGYVNDGCFDCGFAQKRNAQQ